MKHQPKYSMKQVERGIYDYCPFGIWCSPTHYVEKRDGWWWCYPYRLNADRELTRTFAPSDMIGKRISLNHVHKLVFDDARGKVD